MFSPSHFRLCFPMATLALAVSSVTGCAMESSPDEAGVESDESALTSAAESLIGSYVGDSGRIKGLVLTGERIGQRAKFFADIDTDVRCVVAPCPSTLRIEGTFSAGVRTLTLRSTSPNADRITGRYEYLREGDRLTLTKGGERQALERKVSYCATSADCADQNVSVPACAGQFDCVSNACSFACTDSEVPCSSSATCGSDQHCSTEDGVCRSSGTLAVCMGTCVPGRSQF